MNHDQINVLSAIQEASWRIEEAIDKLGEPDFQDENPALHNILQEAVRDASSVIVDGVYLLGSISGYQRAPNHKELYRSLTDRYNFEKNLLGKEFPPNEFEEMEKAGELLLVAEDEEDGRHPAVGYMTKTGDRFFIKRGLIPYEVTKEQINSLLEFCGLPAK